jgi:hypothetical protein
LSVISESNFYPISIHTEKKIFRGSKSLVLYFGIFLTSIRRLVDVEKSENMLFCIYEIFSVCLLINRKRKKDLYPFFAEENNQKKGSGKSFILNENLKAISNIYDYEEKGWGFCFICCFFVGVVWRLMGRQFFRYLAFCLSAQSGPSFLNVPNKIF